MKFPGFNQTVINKRHVLILMKCTNAVINSNFFMYIISGDTHIPSDLLVHVLGTKSRLRFRAIFGLLQLRRTSVAEGAEQNLSSSLDFTCHLFNLNTKLLNKEASFQLGWRRWVNTSSVYFSLGPRRRKALNLLLARGQSNSGLRLYMLVLLCTF